MSSRGSNPNPKSDLRDLIVHETLSYPVGLGQILNSTAIAPERNQNVSQQFCRAPKTSAITFSVKSTIPTGQAVTGQWKGPK